MGTDVQRLFAECPVATTAVVADLAQISRDSARAWAWLLRVPRIRGAFVWTKRDTERLVDRLARRSLA
jgi:hypothetical protein